MRRISFRMLVLLLLLLPVAGHTAWRNICPALLPCSFAAAAPPAELFGDIVLGFAASTSLPEGESPKFLVLRSGVASRPSWEHAANGWLTQRSDGGILSVDENGSRIIAQDGRLRQTVPCFGGSALDCTLNYGFFSPVGPLIQDGSASYFGTLGSSFRLVTSLDEGSSWQSANSTLYPGTGNALFRNPFGSGLWMIAWPSFDQRSSLRGLFLTRDQGAHWQRVDDTASLLALNASLNDIAVNSSAGGSDATVYAASTVGVLVSHDRGAHWSLLKPTAQAVSSIALIPGTTRTLVAATASEVIVSRDGGATWSPFSLGLYATAHRVYYLDGQLLAAGGAGWYVCEDLACDGLASPAAAQGTATEVIEFYNAPLDHYFIASDRSEIAAIEAGSAGPGWTRTGWSFHAWMPLGNAIGKAVCRFYGSLSPGPNSHFFSANPEECASLHRLQRTTPDTQKRWNYEGETFMVEAIDPATGACRSDRIAVYRAYNNGAARGMDANHRLVPSRTEIERLVAQGWHDEGVAFCAQQ